MLVICPLVPKEEIIFAFSEYSDGDYFEKYIVNHCIECVE